MTREKVEEKTPAGKTIHVTWEIYAMMLKQKAKMLLKDTRPLENRKDYSENDVIAYLFQNQKEEDENES